MAAFARKLRSRWLDGTQIILQKYWFQACLISKCCSLGLSAAVVDQAAAELEFLAQAGAAQPLQRTFLHVYRCARGKVHTVRTCRRLSEGPLGLLLAMLSTLRSSLVLAQANMVLRSYMSLFCI